MVISASSLRQNIYKMLDKVIETGVPIEIERKHQRLKIIPLRKKGKLANLKKHSVMKCPPDEIVHIDWSKEWKP